MSDVTCLRDGLASVVSDLLRSAVSEMFSAAEERSLNKPSPGNQDSLDAVMDSLCVEAVEKILRMVGLAAGRQEEPAGELKPSEPAEESREGWRSKGHTAASPPGSVSGEEAGGLCVPQQTFILLYESAVMDSDTPLLSLQSCADGGNEPGSTRHSEVSSPPTARAEYPDHEYARPSSTAVGRGSSVPRHRKQGSRPRDPEATEPHHSCSGCSMLFLSAERLQEHQRKAHPACSVCTAVFTGILKLREHETKEHGLLPYSCDYCPKRFNHKAHRNRHIMARHTGEKTCHCDVCGKGYSCISMLKTHRMTHFQKTFICDVCGKSFYHACHLTRHKLVHQEVKPYRCSTCGKGFTQAENLKSHRAVHTGERQLCSVCGKSYRCLKNHVISKHSHELPARELPAHYGVVSCEVCGKKFPNASQYKVHQRSHTGEKPFHCDVCGKSYRLKEMLRDHRYTHTGEKPYKCSLCPKAFSQATSFMRHRSIHSGQTPYSCTPCGKHFRLLTFLKAHLLTKAHLRQTQSPSDL
ncbi:uncharacterized protein LOC143010397 [Genypterus blacodes]|uniref:uncharacterized protein LOC143010397 n=1 Tax=Genypterus blacodes TaxID=154954 RepID=UPI003F75A791